MKLERDVLDAMNHPGIVRLLFTFQARGLSNVSQPPASLALLVPPARTLRLAKRLLIHICYIFTNAGRSEPLLGPGAAQGRRAV